MEFRSALVGRFRGDGRGWYPTIADFVYHETVEIVDVGRPFLTYRQVTQRADGSPLHTETGYLRFPAHDRMELVVAQPTGLCEALDGSVSQDASGRYRAHLASIGVVQTATAKEVSATERVFVLNGAELTVELWMAAVGQPLQQHLVSHLRRDS